jgi:DNA replication and repair protein RecF
MYLKNLKLLNFKNYEEINLSFSPKINCFVGDNGVGKTNILDSIYYLSLCKSYFNPVDQQNIRHQQDYFGIQGNYQRNNQEEVINCSVVKNKKKHFKRNNKEYPRLSDHIGLIPVVMTSPYDTNLITEGSEERRKFINSVVSQYDKEYLHHLMRYNKALAQRNKLLKEFAEKNTLQIDMLEAFNDQLIRHGSLIFERRQIFINELLPLFENYYKDISGNKEKVTLSYESQLSENKMEQLLNDSLQKDRVLTYTSTGIHKDDLIMEVEGYPIKKSGSQGQQKTFLVALKMAKFDFIKKHIGFKPILLLDDIFDKFDHNRVKQIVKLVDDEHFGQIFITDTEKERIQSILGANSFRYKLFHIQDGSILYVNEI